MKKIRLISAVLSLMMVLSSCGENKNSDDNIYDKIHTLYYSIKSYKTNCAITTYTQGGENSYVCDVVYNSHENSYTVTSEDMKMYLTDNKTVITKGQNTIESPSIAGDMYIFVNTFFKSYYESEDTALSANAAGKSSVHLLESSIVNPTDYVSTMKLWVDSDTAMPKRMQVLNSNADITYEIVFNKFTFEN